ncbi:hypothetical protein [Actinomadura sp. 6N118]|uniref:hypothetical protein n=1 Tax=Actinomadura sp. 6N118 TaxID=3375151 RepID=UPI0037A6D138
MTELDPPGWVPVPTDQWAHAMRERLAQPSISSPPERPRAAAGHNLAPPVASP